MIETIETILGQDPRDLGRSLRLAPGDAGRPQRFCLCSGLVFRRNMLASASCDRTIRLWDVGTGKELKQFLGHSNQDHTQCCYCTSSAC
jgi:WD40 repeat protein